jgi:hypothetical protein
MAWYRDSFTLLEDEVHGPCSKYGGDTKFTQNHGKETEAGNRFGGIITDIEIKGTV